MLTLNRPDTTLAENQRDIGASNMSMATQEYLQRYALSGPEALAKPTPQKENPTPTLKSIQENTIDDGADSEDEDATLQVLDITRLKELPKLL